MLLNALELAEIPLAIAGMVMGLGLVKWGIWNGVIQRHLVTRSGILNGASSMAVGLLIVFAGLFFAFGSFVWLRFLLA